jgi:proteasome-associated ATPase
MEEAAKALAEFEEAYQKLTQPANRIGVYLAKREDKVKDENGEATIETASIAVGDQEFIVMIDPKLEQKSSDRHARQGERSLCHRRRPGCGDKRPHRQNQRYSG